VLNSYFSGEKMQKFHPRKKTEVTNAFKMLGSYLNIQLGAIQVDVFNGWLCDHATWIREQSQKQ
jgi:hypothetical protein